MGKLIQLFIRRSQTESITREDKARVDFEKKAKEQFLRLKEKGLGIRVITL